MVGLVDDEHVKGVAARRGGAPGLGQDVAQETLGAHTRQPVHGDDDARVETEGVGGQSVGATGLGQSGGVDDGEVQAELVPHLLTPLVGQAGRAHNDHRAGPVAQEELLDHQAGLNGLAQADIVGEQQVGARGGQGPAQGLELVELQGDAGAEG